MRIGQSDARALAALLVVVVLISIAAHWALKPRPREGVCPGPHNINLYEVPHAGYPSYEGRGATRWDGTRRCAAYCQQSPCAIWCR